MELYESWKNQFWNPLELFVIYRKHRKGSFPKFVENLRKRAKASKGSRQDELYKGSLCAGMISKEQFQEAFIDVQNFETKYANDLNQKLDFKSANRLVRIVVPGDVNLRRLVEQVGTDPRYVENGNISLRTLTYIFPGLRDAFLDEANDPKLLVKKLQQENESLQKKIEDQRSEIDTFSNYSSHLELQLAGLDSVEDYKNQIKSLENEIEELVQDSFHLESLRNLPNEIERIKADQDKLNTEYLKLEMDKLELEDLVSKKEIEIDNYKSEVAEQNEKIQELTSIKSDYDQLEKLNKTLTQDLDDKDQKIEKYKAKLIELYNQISKEKSDEKNKGLEKKIELPDKQEEKNQDQVLEPTDSINSILENKVSESEEEWKKVVSRVYNFNEDAANLYKKSTLSEYNLEYTDDGFIQMVAEAGNYNVLNLKDQKVLYKAYMDETNPSSERVIIRDAIINTNLRYLIMVVANKNIQNIDRLTVFNGALEEFSKCIKEYDINSKYPIGPALKRRINRGISNVMFELQTQGEISKKANELSMRIKYAQIDHFNAKGRNMTEEELAVHFNVPLRRIKNTLEYSSATTSDLMDSVSTEDYVLEDEILKKEQMRVLDELLKDFSEEEQLIFKLRLEGKTDEDISKHTKFKGRAGVNLKVKTMIKKLQTKPEIRALIDK